MKRPVRILLVAAAIAVALAVVPMVGAAEQRRGTSGEPVHRDMRGPEQGPGPEHNPAPGREEGRRGPRPDGPPKPLVLRFLHIPAESFVQTLKQLARNDRVREGLEQMPLAINEPANAVVIVAPPEVAEMLMHLAKQLDQPNEFAMAERHRMRQDAMGGPGPKQGHPAQMMPGGPKPMQGPPPQMMPGGPGAMQGPQPQMMPGGPGAMQGPRPGMMPGGPKPMQGPRPGMMPGGPGQMQGPQPGMMPGGPKPMQGRQPGMMPGGPGQMQGPPPQMMPGGPGQMQGRRPGMMPGGPMQGRRPGMMLGGRGPMCGMCPMQGGGMRRGEGPGERPQREEMQRGERMQQERRMQRERGEAEPREREEAEGRGEVDRPPPGAREEGRGMPDRGMGPLGRLLTPRGREELGLSDKQAAKIEEILADAREEMQGMVGRIREAMADTPPDERAELTRRMTERLRQERARRMEAVRGRVMDVLTPDQRERAERWLQGPGPGPKSGPVPGRPQPSERRSESERGMPGETGNRPAIHAAYERPARFRLAAEEAGPPPDRGDRRGRPEPGGPVRVLRLLDDPAVRADLKLTPEQEKQVLAAQEKARAIHERIREELKAKAGDRPGPDASQEDRQAFRKSMATAQQEAMRAAGPDLEAIQKEVVAGLTEEQRAKLREIGQERARFGRAAGGLAALLAPPARQRLGINDAQAEKIQAILKELAEAAKKMHDEAAAGAVTEEAKRLHGERIADARRRILESLDPEQRDKAERLLNDVRERAKDRPAKQGRRPVAEPATKGYGQAV